MTFCVGGFVRLVVPGGAKAAVTVCRGGTMARTRFWLADCLRRDLVATGRIAKAVCTIVGHRPPSLRRLVPNKKKGTHKTP